MADDPRDSRPEIPRGGGSDPPFESYFDALPGVVSVQDRELRIIQSNYRLREFFGDPNGSKCYEFFKRRTEKCPDCPVEESFRTGERRKTESVVIKKNGEEMPVMVFTSPIKNDDGEVVHVMKLAADISEVKKLQKKLYRAQQQLKQFFDEVPCYVSVQNRDLELVAANRRFKEDFGDEVVGCHCYETYKHRLEPCLVCPVARTFEDGLSHQSEEIVTTMGGDQYNVMVHTSPIRNEAGDITAVMEMSTNITPLRELQSQLESTGLLISSISHSIKGLLTGLDGGMYLVNTGLKKDDQDRVRKGWEMVSRNVDNIRGTVLNILYYAKEREPAWEEISARDIANESFALVENKAAELKIDLVKDIDADPGRFDGDPLALRSLLVNLLENSLDACRVDRKKPEHLVRFTVGSDDEYVRFEISDNGIGMDRETREKVFTLFFSSKGTEGTGLGLFIANNIAHAHGGTIAVGSETDKGTTFLVKIPRRRQDGVLNGFAV
jgi:PAS domain S-box-containing protein